MNDKTETPSATLRPLPTGHDDENHPNYVPQELRSIYTTVAIGLDEMDAALRRQRANEDMAEDVAAWQVVARSKQARRPDDYNRWYYENTKPVDADNPNGERIPTRRSLSTWLDDRPADIHRGTLESSRRLTESQVSTARHRVALNKARQVAKAAADAPRLLAEQAARETCQVCGIRDSLDVRSESLQDRRVNACRECVAALPIVAALTRQVPSSDGTTTVSRLERIAHWLDQQTAPLTASDAEIDAWLDGSGEMPRPQPRTSTGVMSAMRNALSTPSDPAPSRRRQGRRRT